MVAGNFAGDVVGAYVDTCNSGAGTFTVSKVKTLHENWKQWAIAKGVNKLCGYEGGYSPDMTSSVDFTSPIDLFRSAGKLDLALQVLCELVYQNFVDLTGGGFIAEYPATYFGGTSPTHNIWPIIDDIYTTKYMAPFEAVKAFNN